MCVCVCKKTSSRLEILSCGPVFFSFHVCVLLSFVPSQTPLQVNRKVWESGLVVRSGENRPVYFAVCILCFLGRCHYIIIMEKDQFVLCDDYIPNKKKSIHIFFHRLQLIKWMHAIDGFWRRRCIDFAKWKLKLCARFSCRARAQQNDGISTIFDRLIYFRWNAMIGKFNAPSKYWNFL